jgi:hypothetical protein
LNLPDAIPARRDRNFVFEPLPYGQLPRLANVLGVLL